MLHVAAQDAGQRLDIWLANAVGDAFSRSRVQALIRDGAVIIGDGPVKQPKHKVAAADAVRVLLPEPAAAEPVPQDIPLEILFEDDQLIVIDKPAGMVVHPGAGNWSGTLVNALLFHCGESLAGIGGVRRPGIVHRLDKGTSGVMVAAKTETAHRALSEAFADHGRSGSLERAYLALVWGVPSRPSGTVNAALGRSSRDRTQRAVVSAGREDAREAVTHYTLLEAFDQGGATASLLECRLETGRTHQIRVHMAHIGHPVIGDPDYGQALRTKANRLPEPLAGAVRALDHQMLHAWLLAFDHPATGRHMRFETLPPEPMAGIVAGFRALAGWRAFNSA